MVVRVVMVVVILVGSIMVVEQQMDLYLAKLVPWQCLSITDKRNEVNE